MKKISILFATMMLISSCSFLKEVQSHCKPELVSGDIQTGSFKACLKCDSLAKITYDYIKNQTQKR